MKRTKDELKSAYSRNKKVLEKLKKNVLKIFKSADKFIVLGSTGIADAVKLLKDHEEIISDQLEVTNELIMDGEKVEEYKKRDIFEDVKNGDCAAIALSYINGSALNRKDKDMWTTLHIAALNGHKSVAEFLILMGIEVDSPNGIKQTPLHIAASHDRLEVAKILLQYGANPFAHSKDRQCPTKLSISLEMKDLLSRYEFEYISKHMSEPSKFLDQCKSVMFCAVQHKNRQVMPLLVELHERGKSVGEQDKDERDNGILHVAVEGDDDKILKPVLKLRPFPFRKNQLEQYPIDLAQSEKIKKLIADYEQDYIEDVVSNETMLARLGGDLFLYCVQKGYVKGVEELMRYSGSGLININMRDPDKNTPLHFAAKHGHVEVAAMLLRHHAEMLVFNKDQLMPADFVGNNKQMIRIFNNFERMWVNRIIRQVYG